MLLDFFKTQPDKPLIEDQAALDRLYRKKRFQVYFMLIFGYSFFYVCRLVISFAKPAMIEAGVVNAEQLGAIGSAFFLAYAFGKGTNGFLADRANIGRFMSTGLLVSSIILILFGCTSTGIVFVILWGVNGWFQAMGSAPSGVSISQWFSHKERGTRYSWWSIAHSVGEGVSMLLTAVLISWFGWRFGFWSIGGISILVAFWMFAWLADRPQTYGLPDIATWKNDHPSDPEPEKRSIGQAQWIVFRNPYVWILGLSSAAMYVARYGINSWAPMFLQEAKDYTLISAGMVLGWAKMIETIGALSSGTVSDFFFNSRRNIVCAIYGLMVIGGLVAVYATPSNHLFTLKNQHEPLLAEGAPSQECAALFREKGATLSERYHIHPEPGKDGQQTTVWTINRPGFFWLGYGVEKNGAGLKVSKKVQWGHLGGLSLFCFGMGGILVFLGGLIAIDITTPKARGAALGIVGMFSYLGAAVQDYVSGWLLEFNKVAGADGSVSYNFDAVFYFWIGAAVVSFVLACSLWNVKAKD